jgi:hypothetical protein
MPAETPARDGAAVERAPRRRHWLRRIAWLLALWGASVLALGVVAYAFRGIMGWVGLTR